jgi:hypothetical protein
LELTLLIQNTVRASIKLLYQTIIHGFDAVACMFQVCMLSCNAETLVLFKKSKGHHPAKVKRSTHKFISSEPQE